MGLGDTLMALAPATRTPGLQYVAVRANEVVAEHVHGHADLRTGRAVDARTTFMAYSMSKTLTAVAVLQLVEAGALQLDDPVERHVPIPYGSRVTIRQLITHSSGIPNPLPLRWAHPVGAHGGFDEQAALAAVLSRAGRLTHEPGSKYAYSNIGYWLLGRVIEHTSGERFTNYMTREVLGRLGECAASLSYVLGDEHRQATGYLEKYSIVNLAKRWLIDPALVGEYVGRWLEIRAHYLNGAAFGGLIGTARAFGAFLQDQLRPSSLLLGLDTRALLYTPQQTARGSPIAMTLGWHIGDLRGSRYFFKEGGGAGFRCLMRVYPSEGLGTVVMSNATAFDVRGCLDQADATLLVR